MPAKEFDLRTAIVINEENILTVVAALNNKVRLTPNADSGHATHADNPRLTGRKVKKQMPVATALFVLLDFELGDDTDTMFPTNGFVRVPFRRYVPQIWL